MNWKGQLLEFLVLWALPAGATAILLLRFRDRAPAPTPAGRAFAAGAVLYFLTRIGYMALLYGVAGYAGGGDFHYYADRARWILDGAVPGREFENAYGPLFPYLHALGMALSPGRNPVGILVPYVALDLVAILVACRMAQRLHGEGAARWATAWLILSPLLWHQLILRANNEAAFAAALLGAVWLLHRGRALAGMVVLALGMSATKISFAPYALLVLVAAWTSGAARAGAVAVFVGTCAAVLAASLAAGADPLQVARYPGERVSAFNLSSLAFLLPEGAGRVVALAAYAGVSLWGCLRWGRAGPGEGFLERAAVGIAALHAVTMLVQPFVTVKWMGQSLPFLMMALAGEADGTRKRILILVLAGIGLLQSPCNDTSDPLYLYGVLPLFLMFHAGLVRILWGRTAARRG